MKKLIKKHGAKLASSQKVRFGLVGVVNTVVDFIVLNVLVSVVGIAIVPANIVSTTVAMLTSFTLNKKAVFQGSGWCKAQCWRWCTIYCSRLGFMRRYYSTSPR